MNVQQATRHLEQLIKSYEHWKRTSENSILPTSDRLYALKQSRAISEEIAALKDSINEG